MTRHVLLTGFPGFIGKQLIDRLLGVDPAASFTFLILEPMRAAAQASVAAIDGDHPGFASRVTLLGGDITAPWLGCGEQAYRREAARTTHVWHLAAIYDLAVPAAVAYRVNVLGTANVLDFCEACASFVRLDYVSTCYVAGNRTGTVLESELDCGQGFKNHYESTKAWAEMEVRRRQRRLPICVHRPGIVVGDSRTGETDKYDGPYFMIKLLMRLPGWLPMVNVGRGGARVNLVPIDFLCDGMAAVWDRPAALGQTIQWADGNPHPAREIIASLLEILGRPRALGTVPSGAVVAALGVKKLRQLVQLPKEAVIYFNHEALFDITNQRALLAGTNVRCPDLSSYLPTLVDYVRAHPDKGFLDGRTF